MIACALAGCGSAAVDPSGGSASTGPASDVTSGDSSASSDTSAATTGAGVGGSSSSESSAATGTGGASSSSTGGAASSSTGSTSSSSTGGSASSSSSASSSASTSSSTGAGGASSSSASSAASSSSSSSSSTGGAACQADADCSDGLFCDGDETCVSGACAPGAPPSCSDGVDCTDDFCNLASDTCKHVPNDTKCSDALYCNGAESCDPLNGCTAGTPMDCDDGVACTADTCSDASAACVHVPDNALCSDGLFCNGMETCSAVSGCQPGAPPVCNDGLTCTADACDPIQNACVFTPVDAFCNDGLVCDGIETCDPMGAAPSGCKPGTPVPCASDGIACTTDACTEAAQGCAHTPDSSKCAAGQFCIVLQNGCTSGQPCSTGADCQDNALCDGVETCVAGICQPGTPIDCDDGVGCTFDACAPATGACSHLPNDALCSDGLTCNGVEACDAQMGCILIAPAVNCNDGVGCTIDTCLEPSGTCTHTQSDALCSNGQLCDGIEQCTASGCQPGAPFVCPSDGIACTSEVCDPTINACKSIPNNNQCPCGQTCNAASGCGNFCSVTTCQGKVYQCGDCLDNDSDCAIDSADTECLGPCDNTENSLYGGIPGQNNAPCKMDCYFDADTGAGNDDCYWSHKCDPYEVSPAYPPEGSQCSYSANANIPGYPGTCASADMTQSAQCLSYCGPLTPNGCDCFGCCAIPGAPTTVWLGSENPAGTGSCNLGTLNDPTKCKPCTQVPACLNTCLTCEICVGKPTLPPGCFSQTCPPGVAACGLPMQPACPAGFTCITGCCQTYPG
jgi:hypothetical protein